MARIGRFGTDIPTEAHPERTTDREPEGDPHTERRTRALAAFDRAHSGLSEANAPSEDPDRHPTPAPSHPDLTAERRGEPLRLARADDRHLCSLVARHPADTVNLATCLGVAGRTPPDCSRNAFVVARTGADAGTNP